MRYVTAFIVLLLMGPVAAEAQSHHARYVQWVAENVPLDVVAAQAPSGTGLSFDGNRTEPIRWPGAYGPMPSDAELPSPEGSVAAARAFLATLAQYRRDAAKGLERKMLENAFYQLTQELLVALDDPRKDLPETPKLGFAEMQALIEVLNAANPMAAVQVSLRLLTVDAALKRFDPLWWDDVRAHAIPEE